MKTREKAPVWGKGSGSKSERKHRVAICLETVPVEEVRWLWYPYIPFGKLSCIAGDPGVGKTWLTAGIAAAVSRAQPFPGESNATLRKPRSVLFMSVEDGIGDTLAPRLRAAGADMHKVYAYDQGFTLDEAGVKEAEEMMKQSGATIVFIDPIQAYMGGKTDIHRANEVAAVLGPLAEAARRTGSAVVMVMHLRKGEAEKAIHKVLGSISFVGTVRSAIMVDQDAEGTKFFSHIKHNLTPRGSAWSFRINDGAFEWGERYVEPEPADKRVVTTAKDTANAKALIFDLLKEGPRPANDLFVAAQKMGIGASTLKKAKIGMADSMKTKDGWVWNLLPDLKVEIHA